MKALKYIIGLILLASCVTSRHSPRRILKVHPELVQSKQIRSADPLRESTSRIPTTAATSPSSAETSPSAGTSPFSAGTSPSSAGTSPSSAATSPSSAATSPSSAATSPSSAATSPSSAATSPSSAATSPSSAATSPSSAATSPSSAGTSPSSAATSPTSTGTSPTTAKPTPPHCTPGDKMPVNGSCRSYLECDKTFNWVEQNCSTWCHNYNPTLKKCDWSWKYACVDPTTASPACSSTNKPEPTSTTPAPPTTTVPECTNGKTKVFQKGDCKDYYECDSGKWTKKTCSWGYDFDVNQLECRWSWWAKC